MLTLRTAACERTTQPRLWLQLNASGAPDKSEQTGRGGAEGAEPSHRCLWVYVGLQLSCK